LHYRPLRPPPSPTLIPYTTLFRSARMSTRLYEHDIFLEHRTPEGHPERADRLRSLQIALQHPNFETLDRKKAPQASEDAVLLAQDRKSTRLNSSHVKISYAVFCLK